VVKISSTVDENQEAFKSLSQRESTQGELDDDRPSDGASDDATLAPGLTGVNGLNETVTPDDVAEGNSTAVTRLVLDEVDES
jgi:hypothetical protein